MLHLQEIHAILSLVVGTQQDDSEVDSQRGLNGVKLDILVVDLLE